MKFYLSVVVFKKYTIRVASNNIYLKRVFIRICLLFNHILGLLPTFVSHFDTPPICFVYVLSPPFHVSCRPPFLINHAVKKESLIWALFFLCSNHPQHTDNN